MAVRRFLMPLVVGALAVGATACGAHGVPAHSPMTPLLAVKTPGVPEDVALEETKTVTVDYAFDRDGVAKDFDRMFSDGFDKKGLKVDETLTAHAHLDVREAKLTGTVTYLKKGTQYSLLEADLVATGHYDASMQVDIDTLVKGDLRNAKEGDWDKTLMAGKAIPLAKNVMPAEIPIAGPLVVHAHFDLSAACDMPIEGQVHATAGVGIAGDVRLAAKYKKAGFEGPSGHGSKFQFEADTPTVELAPKPFVSVVGKPHHLKGRCSLQPTVVVVLDPEVGAKLTVEPWVDVDARRASAREKWQLDAQAGVSLYGATDFEVLGRQARKPKEASLFEVTLSKPGDEMGSPRVVAPAVPAKAGRAARVEIASVLGDGLGSATAQKAPTQKAPRGTFGKKKKL